MSAARKVPLCPACILDGGWRYLDDGTVERCDHGAVKAAVDAAEAKDRALAATADAHPDALRAAVRIITDTAAGHETFSANTCRPAMEIAQIPGAVVGAAFGQCVRDGIIRRDGYETSTLANTHGHELKRWRSLIFRPGRRFAS